MRGDARIASGIALAMMIGAAVFLSQAKMWQRLGDPGVRITPTPLLDDNGKKVTEMSVALPEKILEAEGKPLKITQAELGMLPQDTLYGRRLYTWPAKPPVQLNVVLMGADRTSIHRPEYCLIAQGWSFKETDMEAMKVQMLKPHPYELPVMKIVASSTLKIEDKEIPARCIYLYYFVNDRDITLNYRGHLWSQASHMLRAGEMQRWAYVGFFSTCLPGQEAEILEWMKRVVAEAVPEFQIPPGSTQPKSAEGKTEMGMIKTKESRQ